MAEFTANKIARLHTGVHRRWRGSGAHRVHRAEQPAPTLTGIALGPDGNIWFSEYDAGKVGRLIPPSTLRGSPDIDEFPIPHPGSQPVGNRGGARRKSLDRRIQHRQDRADDDVAAWSPASSRRRTAPRSSSPRGPTGTCGSARATKTPSGASPQASTGPPSGTRARSRSRSSGAPDTPASINVSGRQGTITDVNVRLTGISHTFPDDLDVILESPSGRTALIMSDVGSAVGSRIETHGGTKRSYPADGITLTLDDQAARSLSDTNRLISGFYKPTNVTDSDEGTTEGFAPGPFSTVVPQRAQHLQRAERERDLEALGRRRRSEREGHRGQGLRRLGSRHPHHRPAGTADPAGAAVPAGHPAGHEHVGPGARQEVQEEEEEGQEGGGRRQEEVQKEKEVTMLRRRLALIVAFAFAAIVLPGVRVRGQTDVHQHRRPRSLGLRSTIGPGNLIPLDHHGLGRSGNGDQGDRDSGRP